MKSSSASITRSLMFLFLLIAATGLPMAAALALPPSKVNISSVCEPISWLANSTTIKKKISQCWWSYGDGYVNETSFFLAKSDQNNTQLSGSIWSRAPFSSQSYIFGNDTSWNISVTFSLTLLQRNYSLKWNDGIGLWLVANKSISAKPSSSNYGVTQNKDFTGMGVTLDLAENNSLKLGNLVFNVAMNASTSLSGCGVKVPRKRAFILTLSKDKNSLFVDLATVNGYSICNRSFIIPPKVTNQKLSSQVPWLHLGAFAYTSRGAAYEIKEVASSIKSSQVAIPSKPTTTMTPPNNPSPSRNKFVTIGIISGIVLLLLVSVILLACWIHKKIRRKHQRNRADSSPTEPMVLPPPTGYITKQTNDRYTRQPFLAQNGASSVIFRPTNSSSGLSEMGYVLEGPTPKPSATPWPYQTISVEDIPMPRRDLSSTYLRPSSSRAQSTNAEQYDALTSSPFLNDIADRLPYDMETLEIDPSRLRLLGEIGTGAFGVVSKAELELPINVTVSGTPRRCVVAVKRVRNPEDDLQRRTLECEVKLLAHIGFHENVVLLIGAITKSTSDYCVVLEYCDGGNLKHFLHENKQRYRQIDNVMQTKPERTLTRRLLVSLAQQVASGMEFIHSKRCVHRDLAVRNILLCKGGETAKITDFGLAKDIYKDGMYQSVQKRMVPWAWYAPEFLKDSIYVLPSDVWSFGVLLWEVLSLGERPYAGIDWDITFLRNLEDGYRLQMPVCCDDDLYKLMINCWNFEPKERPTFSQISKIMKEWLDVRLQHF